MAAGNPFPAPGSPEREALIQRAAARMWEGRDDRPLAEAGDYWQSTFEKLASDALDAIEEETAKGDGTV